MKKNFLIYIVCWAILFLIFNIVAWVVPSLKQDNYLFNNIIILAVWFLQFVVSAYLIKKRNDLDTKSGKIAYYGSTVFLFIISIVLCIFNNTTVTSFMAVVYLIFNLASLIELGSTKGFKNYLPIWLVIFIATLSLIVIFPIGDEKLSYFIYYFSIGVLVIQLIISYFALKEKNKNVSIPTFSFSVLGLVMLFVINFVIYEYYNDLAIRTFILTNCHNLFFRFIDKGYWSIITVNVFVLFLHYLVLFAVNISQKNNVERDEHVKEKTNAMLMLTNQVKALYDSTNNDDIYKLYEVLRYSDKASRGEGIEEQIAEKIDELAKLSNENEIKERVEQIISLIKQR